MIPRHVRIKKLPAKHKQSQVSEALGPWGVGQRAGAAGSGREGELHREKPPSRQAHSEPGRLQSMGPQAASPGLWQSCGQP